MLLLDSGRLHQPHDPFSDRRGGTARFKQPVRSRLLKRMETLRFLRLHISHDAAHRVVILLQVIAAGLGRSRLPCNGSDNAAHSAGRQAALRAGLNIHLRPETRRDSGKTR
jgi:hypothetical protein